MDFDDQEMAELLAEFVSESRDNLDELDRGLVTLENDPSPELLAQVFRTFHTIKGTSGFLALARLERVTHAGENLLVRLRDGRVAMSTDVASGLLTLVDVVRETLTSLERTGVEGQIDDTSLIRMLERLASGDGGEPIGAATPAPAPTPPPVVDGRGEDPLVDQKIRVDVGLLDSVMNLVGELVLARNQILQYVGAAPDPGFVAAAQRLDLITSELQEDVMRTRMQPMDNVWNKFPRVIRDLAVQCGKQARLEMEGRQTELDKTLLEAIKDPLTHLVRNAVDHGLERPDQRLAAGKPAEGVVRLRAFHEGGQVNIEISDDGRGIDVRSVRDKAIENGLISADEAARRSDRDLLHLIFVPGLSTAATVSNISGRGVGMDVVRTAIEGIGGSVDVQSALGVGTVFKVKIPLTLAIIPALIVRCGSERYAIPQVSLIELIRLERLEAENGIEWVHDVPVHRLRGQLLPLVRLDELFDTPVTEGGDTNIVVLEADGDRFGLVVSEISDTSEIVVRPLSKLLKSTSMLAGATIMGDGEIALVLDVNGIAHEAGMTALLDARELAACGDDGGAANRDGGSMVLLAVAGRRLAIPLEHVSRLEELDTSAVERVGELRVVQYGDGILPLLFLDEILGIDRPARSCGPGADAAPSWVVVYRRADRPCGLVADEILDIIEHAGPLALSASNRDVLGAVVADGHVTEMLDVDAIIDTVFGRAGVVA
jgi:two-component system chemotaxis sensor kinase CheA